MTFFQGPDSYTGEDTVEISCHGGMLVTQTVLDVIIDAGARLAEPGEFSKRSFLRILRNFENLKSLQRAGQPMDKKLKNKVTFEIISGEG